MDRNSHPTPGRRARPLLRDADQVTVVTLVGICFLALLLHGCWHTVIRQQRIEFDTAPPLDLDLQIHLNDAAWPELTLLPDVGETLARRIVEHRSQHGPFQSVDQLREVRGIGPKTLAHMRPYLRVRRE